jgi:hypothetical protein
MKLERPAYISQMANKICIECIGMMAPERFHFLRERFHKAQLRKTDYTEICLLLFNA